MQTQLIERLSDEAALEAGEMLRFVSQVEVTSFDLGTELCGFFSKGSGQSARVGWFLLKEMMVD